MNLNYEELGLRFAARRKKLKLKQAQVSEAADISDNYLSNIERGQSIPSLEVFMRLCNALDIMPDELLLGADREGLSDGDTQKLTQRMKLLDEKQRRLVFGFIDMLGQIK